MHEAEGGRCRFVDQYLGRTAHFGCKRLWWSMSRDTAQRKKRKRCRTLKICILDDGFMADARAETQQQEREEVYAALQYAASFHC